MVHSPSRVARATSHRRGVARWGQQVKLTQLYLGILLVCILGLVSGQTITSMTYGTPTRTFTTSNPATNVIPQVANVLLTYAGSLEASKWVALVDSTLNSGTPCVGATAAASAGNTQSGSIQASGSNVVTIPQGSSPTLLDFSKSFAVCFANNDGTDTDAWTDST